MGLFERLFGRRAPVRMAYAVREVCIGPAAGDATCEQPTPEAVNEELEIAGRTGRGVDLKALPGCGKKATTTEITKFENGKDFVMSYCEEHWKAKQEAQAAVLQTPPAYRVTPR